MRALSIDASARHPAAWCRDDRQGFAPALLLSLLVLLGLTTILRTLADGESRSQAGDRRFHGVTVIALLVYLSVMYWRPVGSFFALTPLTLSQWGWLLPIACGAYLILRLSDSLLHSKAKVS